MQIVENLEKELWKPLVTDYTLPEFYGILSGKNHGDIWVTDIENPQLAIAYSAALQQYCVLGKTTNPIAFQKVATFLLGLKQPVKLCFDQIETEQNIMFLLGTKIKPYTVLRTYQRIIPFQPKELEMGGIYQFEEIKEEAKLKRVALYEKSWNHKEDFLTFGCCIVAEKSFKISEAIISTGVAYKRVSAWFEGKEDNSKVLAKLLKLFTNACTEKGYITCITVNDRETELTKVIKALNFIYIKKFTCYMI